MPETTTISNMLIRSSLSVLLLSLGLALVSAVVVNGGWWMVPAAISALSVAFLLQQLKIRRQELRARERLVQSLVDQLLLAETPDERQPIIETMSAQNLLKGIRLSSSDLEDLDLSFADLTNADLSGATLSGANLTGANLSGATLSYATLTYTTLCGANIRGANLRGVNLHASDLRQTDLTNAFMRGANLEGAALNGAVLHNAQLHGANLKDADLSNAQLDGADFTRAILPNGWLDRLAQTSEDSAISQHF